MASAVAAQLDDRDTTRAGTGTRPSTSVISRQRAGLVLHYLDNGRDSACPLTGATSVAFENQPPVVRPHASGGHRGNAGLYYAASLRAHVQYPTWLARDEALVLDFDRDVRRFAASPFRLSWPGTSGRSHVPTFFARRVDGSVVVVDCRANHRASNQVGPRTSSRADTSLTKVGELQDLYASIGWTYRVVSDHDQIWMSNLQWLGGYRHPRYHVPATAARLLHRFTSPTALVDGIDEPGNPLAVLPVLYHLLWRRRLTVDLSKVLDGSAVVHTEEHAAGSGVAE